MKTHIKKIILALFLISMFVGEGYLTWFLTWNSAQDRIQSEKLQSFRYDMDESIPFLTYYDNISILLENPDRGFRLETYLTLGTNLSYPTRAIVDSDEDANATLSGAYTELQSKLVTYAQDKPKIVQQYVYLTLYRERQEIPQKALDALTAYFAYMKSLHLKILLRFAYRNEHNEMDPTQEILLAHVAELKEWFENNSQLVVDTVYCLQLGFLGYWGEGWGYEEDYDLPLIITAVCEMVPSWMYVNVRTLGYYNQTPVQYRSRVGVHDDFLIGHYDEISTVMPKDKFQQAYYRDIFQRTINDGELVWGAFAKAGGYRIEGKIVTQYVYDYSLSSLSIVHAYIEDGLNNPYDMYRWKTEYLNAQALEENHWSFNPHLLNENGEISIFDYLKFHVGYQLVLSNLTAEKDRVKFMISNFGFAAPFNMDKLVLQVTHNDLSVENISLTYTPHALYSFGQVVYSVAVDLDTVESVSVKLCNSKNGDFVRFGNNIGVIEGFYELPITS